MLILGLLLILLGIGNLAMGEAKLDQYDLDVREAVALGGPGVMRPYRGTASILEPASDAQLLYETALIKRDYYRVIRRGGRLLTTLGAVLVVGALLRQAVAPSRGPASADVAAG